MASVVGIITPHGMWDQAIEQINSRGLRGFGPKYAWMGSDEAVNGAITKFYEKNPRDVLDITEGDDLVGLSNSFIDGLKFSPSTADMAINNKSHNFICLDPRILRKLFEAYVVPAEMKEKAVLSLVSRGQIPLTSGYEKHFLGEFSANRNIAEALEERKNGMRAILRSRGE